MEEREQEFKMEEEAPEKEDCEANQRQELRMEHKMSCRPRIIGRSEKESK